MSRKLLTRRVLDASVSPRHWPLHQRCLLLGANREAGHSPHYRRISEPNKEPCYQQWLNSRRHRSSSRVPVCVAASAVTARPSSAAALVGHFSAGSVFRFSSATCSQGSPESCSATTMSRDPATDQLNDYKKSVKVSFSIIYTRTVRSYLRMN